MDQPLPAPEAFVRPWRNAAIVASAIALVELLALVVIGGGALARAVSARVERAATSHVAASTTRAQPVTRKPTHVAAARLPRSRTKIAVLNGNGHTGAAAAAAARVRRRGYEIGEVANAPKRVSRTIVMFRPGFAGEGRRLGRDLRVGLVGPLDGIRVRQLRGAQVVLVLGG